MTQSCEEIRTALSARLDGEDPGPVQTRIEEHLVGCAGCRAWHTAAEQVTRTVRLSTLAAPDLTARILTAVAVEQSVDRRGRAGERRRILQIALGVSAAVQLALAIPALFLTGIHTGRENASFDIALAVGFALAAWRPERARAFVPVAFVLAGCLAITSISDVASGAAILSHEISHAAAVAQAVLLLALARLSTPTVLRGAPSMVRTS